jgi:hypothetical protein
MSFAHFTSGYATDQPCGRQMHKNYRLHMQTLISQKAIEAPGAKIFWWQFW